MSTRRFALPDVWLGVTVIIISIVLGVQASFMSFAEKRFPLFVLGWIVLCAIVIVTRGLATRSDDKGNAFSPLQLGIGAGSLIATFLLTSAIGFYPALFLLAFFYSAYLGRVNSILGAVKSLLFSAITIAGTYVIFTVAVGVRPPIGVLFE